MDSKRLFDLCIAVPALILTLPLQVAVAAAIWITMGRPIFFVQKRPGLYGRPFSLVKFRTMQTSVSDAPYATAGITRLGHWLRKSSLDELPELVNVIKGDMSLVGPRPLLLDYLPLYSDQQSRRHEVRPGITGLAQVNGRNSLSWERRFRYDVWYVEHRSIALDLHILGLTVLRVLKAHDVNQSESLTMEPFRGKDV